MSVESLLSKLFGVDVGAINDGHGIGCPCPKHMSERQAQMRKIMRDGPAPGTMGALLDDEISAAVGRRVLAKDIK